MKPHFLVVLSIGELFAADALSPMATASEIENLQGTWKVTALEADGATALIDQVQGLRLVVAGESFVVVDNHTTTHGTLKVDPEKSPKTIDLTFTDGPNKGKTSLGIYDLAGSTLKLCMSQTGKSRPRTFATKPGSDTLLEVLARAKN
jgi:uncharacterized protein (TIGR03067 family)